MCKLQIPCKLDTSVSLRSTLVVQYDINTVRWNKSKSEYCAIEQRKAKERINHKQDRFTVDPSEEVSLKPKSLKPKPLLYEGIR
jgi:hypothetical protein